MVSNRLLYVTIQDRKLWFDQVETIHCNIYPHVNDTWHSLYYFSQTNTLARGVTTLHKHGTSMALEGGSKKKYGIEGTLATRDTIYLNIRIIFKLAVFFPVDSVVGLGL